MDHVGGRQLVRDQDALDVEVDVQRKMTGMAGQCLQYALHHLHHVFLAAPQVDVVDFLETRHQRFHLLRQRPFGIALGLADQALGFLGDHGVAEEHQVHVEKRG
jgi:hypothetical protein